MKSSQATFSGGSRGYGEIPMCRLDRLGVQVEGESTMRSKIRLAAFTLVEILVVVSIIGLLAGLSIPAVGGALGSARKAKASAMAHQIRTALTQFNTEYGYYPTTGLVNGVGTTSLSLSLVLTGTDTNANPRQIVFLEVPPDFTFDNNISNRGIVTPKGYFKTGQSNFSVAVDHDYNGKVATNSTGGQQDINASVAVWFADSKDPKKVVGTWK